MRSRLILLILLFGLPACATVTPPSAQKASVSQEAAVPLSGIEHIVAKGETLWRISKIYRVDLEEILNHNKISDGTMISVGQKIYIPDQSVVSPPTPKTNFNNQEDPGFIWPSKGKIVARFKEKINGVANKGIDILTTPTEDVLAASPGKIAFIGELAGYGQTLIIDHGDSISTVYCGNSNIEVKIGDEVKQGMIIAKTGPPLRKNSGSLHFEIRKNYKPQNPLYYLN